MHSPTAALVWEILNRKRTQVWIVLGLTGFGYIFNLLMPQAVREAQDDRFASGLPLLLNMLNLHVTAGAFLLGLAIFSYTEFNAAKSSYGFPHRLFALPVTTFKLVAVPMFVSVVAVEFVALTITMLSRERSVWPFLMLGLYMVLHQTVLWTVSAARSLRLLLLGLIAIVLIMAPIFPSVRRLPETVSLAIVIGVALAAFMTSWGYVAWQRTGGSSRDPLKTFAETMSRLKPSRDRVFRSAQSAHFWFEWRRCGSVLPLLVTGVLVVVIAPLSWYLQDNAADSSRILVATLAMPMVFALAIGKAFSRPDFWSVDLVLPSFIAVRPLSNDDIVAAKIKVAAASTALSWSIVLAFLSIWLRFWAHPDSLSIFRGALREIQQHSLYSSYFVAALSILACGFVTWKFLIGGLWLGLSGQTRVFALSAAPYVLVPMIGFPAVLIGPLRPEQSIPWINRNLDALLSLLVWSTVVALAVKLCVAFFSWRHASQPFIRRYFSIWILGTLSLMAVVISISNEFAVFVPAQAHRLRILLILAATLVIPLARIGLAPAFLTRNRHR